MKKKIVLLSALFIVFLTLGIWLNTQRGIYHSDKFWREVGEQVFIAGNGDRVEYSKDGGNTNFDITLGGKDITAVAKKTDGKIETEFSDGWTAILYGYDDDFAWPYDERDEIAINDIDAMGLRFSTATGSVRREPFYGDNDEIIGESVLLDTESGESVYAGADWYTTSDPEANHCVDIGSTWYNIGKSTDKTDTVTLKNGSVLNAYLYDSGYTTFENERSGLTLYQNERSEYLLDGSDLFNIDFSGDTQRRTSFARFLEELSNTRVGRRGEFYVVFIYALFYVTGALTYLFPQKAAFWLNRWRFEEDPVLSEAGESAEKLSGIVMMVLGVFLMFIPIFVLGR